MIAKEVRNREQKLGIKRTRVELFLHRIARDFDTDMYNPPMHLRHVTPDLPKEWLEVGLIPRPTTKLGWFVHHMAHGLAMRYPLRSVIAFSLMMLLRRDS